MAGGLLAVGLVTLDIVAYPIDELPDDETTRLVESIVVHAAGTAGGTALIAARLGMPARVASAVGDDLVGRFVRFALERYGVETALLQQLVGLPSSTTVLAVDSAGRRPNFNALGAAMLTEIDDGVTRAAEAASHLHYAGVGGVKLDGGPGAGLLRSARDNGTIVTCDLIAPTALAGDELRRILPMVDYFMPSRAEVRTVLGTDDLARGADEFLAMGARNVIIKDGADGSYAALGSERIRVPAHVIKPVDTTSCGDGFCAGFIAALGRGAAPLEACRFATATSALVALGAGTFGKLESYEATVEAVRTMPLGAQA